MLKDTLEMLGLGGNLHLMPTARWQLVVANYSGVIYTVVVMASVTMLNLRYTCPAVYGENQCFWPSVYALVILAEIGVNLALFHYFNTRNQIAYWTVKSNAFLSHDHNKRNSDSGTAQSGSVHWHNDATLNRRSNGNCSISMPNNDDSPDDFGRISAAFQEETRLLPEESHDGERSEAGAESPHINRTKVLGELCPQQHAMNHYQHKSSTLLPTTDGRYRPDPRTPSPPLSPSPTPHPFYGSMDSQSGPGHTKFCVDCNKVTPKRCHHCPLCNICVLRKDHHCFLTGGCVGLANQRYFIVFLFWAAIGSIYGSMLNFAYLNAFVTPWYPTGWLYYIGPVAVIRWLLGYEQFFNMWLAVLFSMSVSSFFGALVFFVLQMFYTLQGYTMHDYHVSRLRDQLESDGDTYSERIALVFGKRWLVNFVIPQFWLCNQMTPGIARNVFMSISKDL
ncbi:DHHC palmitoyltransferase domain-containing protein [Ditylenchus destructor]|uniref:Palmitoyltransferase n=1 Tax=Ditylenchus destructor TaxID=166010 RepID=A0AAD4MJA6_9BILA|nr:DHHC palmitoyltransferase domain-containing protein [Ditylenchus destructor]